MQESINGLNNGMIFKDVVSNINIYLIFLSALFTSIASGIAIYIFFFKRTKISSAINLLLNFSNQLSLSDLKSKIERLNDFNANEPTHKENVINILSEIQGHIIGNKILKEHFNDILVKINRYTGNTKDFSEPIKRSLISEIRETIRNIDVSNYKIVIKN
ncbi:hypothetical protein ES705_11598 [subsurface metagenome]